MKKRIIGMTTAIAMALSVVPASVGAAELNQNLFPKGEISIGCVISFIIVTM